MTLCVFANELEETSQAHELLDDVLCDHAMLEHALLDNALFVPFEDRLWYTYIPGATIP